jgi:ABC-type transport system involved in multi-copper enzyme maturation permease subunit
MAFFDDPLTRRELSGIARRWQTFAARVVIGVFIGWAVYYLWERSAWHGQHSALAALSREVFTAYFGGLMAFLPLLAVSAASDLITKEVRNGTLGLLFLTPLTPWRIAAGKWKAAMAQALLILFAGGPVAAICVYLGGVGAWEIVWGCVLPLATAGFAAAVALFFSTVFRGPATTVVVSILALLAGIVGPVWLLKDTGRNDGLEILAVTHPVFAALVSAEPRVARDAELSLYAWIPASVVAALCAWGVVFAAAMRLPGRVHAVAGPSLLSRFMAELDRFYESINVGRVRLLARSGEVWQSGALLWKELRTRTSGKLRHATRISLALLLLAMIPFSGLVWDLRDGLGLLMWAFPCLLALQAVVTGVSLFVHEREGRQWDVLLSTPLTSGQIVMSKLAGGLAGLAPTAIIGLLCLGALCAVHPNGGELWWVSTVPAGTFSLFAYLLSAAASMRATTHRGAFGMSTGILLALLAGLPAVAGALDSLPGWRLDVDELLAWSNPAYYQDLPFSTVNRSYGNVFYNMDGSYFVLYMLLYGGASVGLLAWMRLRFDRLAGRA